MPSALAKEEPRTCRSADYRPTPPYRSDYTYADVLEWSEDFRAEIIEGELFMMSPPVRKHQGISGGLYLQIATFLKGKPCKVYAAPFGVRLYPRKDHRDKTVLEPDISVICDSSKLDDRGCNGAPDLIIEILSPSTKSKDTVRKFNLYLDAGVREYWIVDPDTETVQVYVLENGRYADTFYGIKPEDPDTIAVTVLPGCVIDLKEVFAE
jgi:Uma2 family endonuclease